MKVGEISIRIRVWIALRPSLELLSLWTIAAASACMHKPSTKSDDVYGARSLRPWMTSSKCFWSRVARASIRWIADHPAVNLHKYNEESNFMIDGSPRVFSEWHMTWMVRKTLQRSSLHQGCENKLNLLVPQ